MVVRVRKAPGGKLAFDVASGSSLDPTERQCVLEALSTLEVDESATAWTGISIPPSGFTSLLTHRVVTRSAARHRRACNLHVAMAEVPWTPSMPHPRMLKDERPRSSCSARR